jgi:hypothetical protein
MLCHQRNCCLAQALHVHALQLVMDNCVTSASTGATSALKVQIMNQASCKRYMHFLDAAGREAEYSIT